MNLEALIERLEKLQGPDREVDFWLSIRLPIGEPTRHSDEELQADIDLVGIDGMVIDAPYTSSLDAAIALVERVLPGWKVGMDPRFYIDDQSVKWDAIICIPHWNRWTPSDSDWIERIEARHVLAPVAVCLATLRAMKDKSHDS